MRVCDLTTDQELQRLPHSEEVNFLAISPDRKLLVSKRIFSTNLWFWDLSSGRLLGNLDTTEEAGGPTFSPDGKLLALCDGIRVHLFDPIALRKVRDWQANDYGASHPVFSPDGRSVVTVSSLQLLTRPILRE